MWPGAAIITTGGPDPESRVRISLLPSGRTFEAEAGEPVLTAALRAGLNLPHSCKGGRCGSCRARVIQGRIAYPGPRPPGLSEDEERAGHALLCQARVLEDLIIETREIARVTDVEIAELPCRVARMERLASDVMGLWLKLPAVVQFTWLPGQYVDIMLEGGRRRSFSLANPPHDGALLELHVRRSSRRGFTEHVFTGMKPGALLRIEGPLGQFVYRSGVGPLLLVGGGTGYAPLKSLLRHVLETGIRREVTLWWGARTREGLYEDAWLRELAAREPRFTYRAAVSDEPGDSNLAHGQVHEAVIAAGEPLADRDIYTAGPPEMIAAIRKEFVARGASPARLTFDSFDFPSDNAEPPGTSR
jgi:CDP-4-dehydro-6-deoxyglucose reductase